MNKNSIIIFLLITIMLIPNTTLALTNDFPDTKNHWANEFISNLVLNNIISGYPDGNFYPNNQIKVSEFTKIIINSLGETIDNSDSVEWYIPYVNKAKELDIINEGEFDTYNRNITRAEMCRMVVRALNEMPSDGNTTFIDDTKISEEFSGYVKKSVELNIVNGYPDNSFKPDNTVTRAEACKIISVSREKLKNQSTTAVINVPNGSADVSGIVVDITNNNITILPSNIPNRTSTTREEGQSQTLLSEDISTEELQEKLAKKGIEPIKFSINNETIIFSANKNGEITQLNINAIQKDILIQVWFNDNNSEQKTAKAISISKGRQ